ncbi:MAG: PQQ-dependent sugar dehydrogenase [Actinomycetota bacterium]|nr:PQQ-dependent sugar dehydrogenase [Actinomycetota bacterium]
MSSPRPFAAPLLLALFTAAMIGGPSSFAGAAEKPPVKKGTFKNRIIFSPVAAVKSPTVVTSAPGFKKLVYVASRLGQIRVIRQGRLLPRPMLDISAKVNTLWIEQGLLGLAFAPDFAKSRLFYVHYTAKNGDVKVDEYQADPRDPTRTLRGNPRNLIRIPRVSESGNHNGGTLRFLGDHLYIAVGDGNDPGDALNVAQNLESLRGKILRIDPRPDQVNNRTYRIPSDNPFVGKAGRDEIFAYGFRNPHNFGFYRPSNAAGTQMVITDVGQTRGEEMNVLSWRAAWGANFGWKMFEGLLPYNCGPEQCPNGFGPIPPYTVTWPVLTYSHKSGCAIIGGPYIRDPSLTRVSGRIIYGDFCRNRIRTVAPSNTWITDDRHIGTFIPPGKGEHPALNGFGEDGWGRVYAFSDFGGIYRLEQVTVRVKPKNVSCRKKPAQKRCNKKAGSKQQPTR